MCRNSAAVMILLLEKKRSFFLSKYSSKRTRLHHGGGGGGGACPLNTMLKRLPKPCRGKWGNVNHKFSSVSQGVYIANMIIFILEVNTFK